MLRWLAPGLVLLSSALAAAQGVWRGPYLNDITTDAVTVVWETPTATTGVVRYGLMSVSENTAVSSTPATHHAVRLTGLPGAPGDEIMYELEVNAQTRSGIFSKAVDSTTPFAFLIYGDNRSNSMQHTAVIDAILTEPTPYRFIVSTGDMVSDGQNEAHWDEFFQIEAPVLADTPLFTAIGNHEVDGTDWDVTERIFEHPTGNAPASGTEAFYQLVYGNVQLIVVDAGYVHGLWRLDNFVWGTQETWLQDVLDNPPPNIDHRFVFLHSGPYSSKGGRTGNLVLRLWLDQFEMNDIDVIFSGHDHYAERGWTHNGIWYAIHGGGGAPLYDTMGARTTLDHTIAFSESRLGYILVEVDGTLAQVTTKDLDGGVVDYFSYGDAANRECTVTPDCSAVQPPQFGCTGGSYVCRDFACVFTCVGGGASLLPCTPLPDNCDSMLGASCAGTATCVTPEPLDPQTWHCVCPDQPAGDCTVAGDCTGRPPPIPGCVGTWDCVSQACEFSPTMGVCQPPAPGDGNGPTGGDSATAGGDGAGGDATGPPAPSAGPPDRGCECAATSPLGFSAILALAWRRRRRQRRA